MPKDFREKKYSLTRVITDCIEVECEMPSSLHLNGELLSNYKHHTTLKVELESVLGVQWLLLDNFILEVFLTEK